MAKLIIPNPQQHKFVVGIDFGHGETSAAICEIDWDKPDGLSKVSDVRISPANTGNENVIVSAISQITNTRPQIGENAFCAEQLQNNASIRVCFKEPPHSIDGKAETLMIAFMKAVYEKIRDISFELTDGNHIVYIARPSGWQDKAVKELYMQMALRAGLPLGGLTSESRAAIFYALNNPRIAFENEMEEGAIVFDLGSSTLDFTYIAKDHKPVDYGYPHGASLIDRVIFEDKMASCTVVKRLLASHPKYEPALLFQARKLKEDFYKKTLKTAAINTAVSLREIISRDCSDYNNLKDEQIIFEYENLDAFNETLEKQIGYKTKIREDLADFKNNHIAGKEIKGVFLTGGASRMGFISEIICEEYGLSPAVVKVDPDNPSLTISRGIAMIGRADALSRKMEEELYAKAKSVEISPILSNFETIVSFALTKLYWTQIASVMESFKESDEDISLFQLFCNVEDVLTHVDVILAQKNTLKLLLGKKLECLRKELNSIISMYRPGHEIKEFPIDMSFFMNSSQISDLMGDIVKKIRIAVRDSYFNVGAGSILFRFFKEWLSSQDKKGQEYSDEMKIPIGKKKRKEIFESFSSTENVVCNRMKNSISSILNRQHTKINESFGLEVQSYIKNFIRTNIENVKIDIE